MGRNVLFREMLMKKWFILAVVLMMVAGVQAKEKKNKGGSDGSTTKSVRGASITKDAFIASEKQKAEVSGQTFDEAAVEAAFAEKDKNGDGVLTSDEQPSTGGKKAKAKKSK